MWPSVIGVNGPPHSGKGWLLTRLGELIPDAVRINVQDGILESMKRFGLAPLELDYPAYKNTPDSRARMIEHAQAERAKDRHVFSRIITDMPHYRDARVLLFDNIGFYDEVDWFSDRSECLLVLRIDTPYLMYEPSKGKHRRYERECWAGDSRYPVEPHKQAHTLTAYDSLQMWHLLQWLAGDLTREEAGPYYEYKSAWNRWFAHRNPGPDLFEHSRVPGQLERLDYAAESLALNRRLGLDTKASGTTGSVGRD